MSINYKKLVEEYLKSTTTPDSIDSESSFQIYHTNVLNRIKNNSSNKKLKLELETLFNTTKNRLKSESKVTECINSGLKCLFEILPPLASKFVNPKKNDLDYHIQKYIEKFSGNEKSSEESFSGSSHFLIPHFDVILKTFKASGEKGIMPSKFRKLLERRVLELSKSYSLKSAKEEADFTALLCNILVDAIDFKKASILVDKSRARRSK